MKSMHLFGNLEKSGLGVGVVLGFDFTTIYGVEVLIEYFRTKSNKLSNMEPHNICKHPGHLPSPADFKIFDVLQAGVF